VREKKKTGQEEGGKTKGLVVKHICERTMKVKVHRMWMHTGFCCSSCKAEPILGARHHCDTCNCDLCPKCVPQHAPEHTLSMIRKPAAPIVLCDVARDLLAEKNSVKGHWLFWSTVDQERVCEASAKKVANGVKTAVPRLLEVLELYMRPVHELKRPTLKDEETVATKLLKAFMKNQIKPEQAMTHNAAMDVAHPVSNEDYVTKFLCVLCSLQLISSWLHVDIAVHPKFLFTLLDQLVYGTKEENLRLAQGAWTPEHLKLMVKSLRTRMHHRRFHTSVGYRSDCRWPRQGH
jgi:hypothetical protein